jgi:hypothetical protein
LTSRWPTAAPPQGASELAGLVLAGFLTLDEASARLGIDSNDLAWVLTDLGLQDAAIIPVHVDDKLHTYFLDLGRESFAAPLYDEIVDAYRETQTGLGFCLSADSILASGGRPQPDPKALVFHVGRCGSTLLCNLLSSDPDRVVIKEPEFINSLLLSAAMETDTGAKDRIWALITCLLRSLTAGVRVAIDGSERECVVKLTSWNLLHAHEIVRRLGPIPLVVVVREPWATVASFLQERPYWYGSRPADQDLLSTRARQEDAGLFAASWSRTIEIALSLPQRQTLFVSYREIVDEPDLVLERVNRHLGDGRNSLGSSRIQAVLGQYSKGGRGETFDPDGRHLREGLSEDLRDLVSAITARSRTLLVERVASQREA